MTPQGGGQGGGQGWQTGCWTTTGQTRTGTGCTHTGAGMQGRHGWTTTTGGG